ncbi:MAG: hypothetical protein LBG44_11725 [Gemmatimonadota bacterium]|nr:hypothetical protein [Gemmatimonadota bacterium]
MVRELPVWKVSMRKITKQKGTMMSNRGLITRYTGVTIITVLYLALPACSDGGDRGGAGSAFPEQSVEVVAPAFDIPSFLGKSIDEVRAVLGTPREATAMDPTPEQIEMGRTVWSNVFENDGQDLMIVFNAVTRETVEFFLDGNNAGVLSQRGNLSTQSPAYRIEPVTVRGDTANIVGIKVVPAATP